MDDVDGGFERRLRGDGSVGGEDDRGGVCVGELGGEEGHRWWEVGVAFEMEVLLIESIGGGCLAQKFERGVVGD